MRTCSLELTYFNCVCLAFHWSGVRIVCAQHSFLGSSLFFAARGYTSAYINPSLAYGLTFHCPGFTFTDYALVYWLGSLTGKWHSKLNICASPVSLLKWTMSMFFLGMMLALVLYMGHIPRIFSKNLLYSQKSRFRVPKGDKGEKKKMWTRFFFLFL